MSAVAALDVSSVATGISNQEGSMIAVGLAILGALIVVLAFRLGRRMLEGGSTYEGDGNGDPLSGGGMLNEDGSLMSDEDIADAAYWDAVEARGAGDHPELTEADFDDTPF